MSGQDRYDGPKDHPKNLATQSDIDHLQDQINDQPQTASGMVCYPDDNIGIKLNRTSNTQTVFQVDHPAMSCKDVCIWDNQLEQWVAVAIEDTSPTLTTLTFGESPESNRYCVFIRGVPIA